MPRQETIDKRIAAGLCPSWIGHGPGHQSTTFCTQQGEHEIHSARYGSFDQYAEWGGGATMCLVASLMNRPERGSDETPLLLPRTRYATA